jgi:hypothetical protein
VEFVNGGSVRRGRHKGGAEGGGDSGGGGGLQLRSAVEASAGSWEAPVVHVGDDKILVEKVGRRSAPSLDYGGGGRDGGENALWQEQLRAMAEAESAAASRNSFNSENWRQPPR